MNKIEINNQQEMDAVPDNFTGKIRVIGILQRITKHYPNANIYVYGNAQISNVYGNAQISNVYGNAQIRYVYGNAQISNVDGNAQISNVYGNAQIRYVDGNAAVLFIDGKAKVQCKGKNIVSYYNDKNVELDLSKQTTIVVLDRFNATLESYLSTYPIEVKDNVAIMYKTVHKLDDGRFVSNYDKSFEYKIGEVKTEFCSDNKNDSCDKGIQVSYKMWAIRFGTWENVALLEFEVPLDKIVIAFDCDGKVRTSECKCIREIPKEDWYK